VLSAAELAVGEEPWDLEARDRAATERIQSDCPHHPDAFAVESSSAGSAIDDCRWAAGARFT